MRAHLALLLAVLLAAIGCTPVDAPPTPSQSGQDPRVIQTPEQPSGPTQPSKATEPLTCLARYGFDSHDSILDEQRSHAGAKRWDDFVERYAAKVIDPKADHPVEPVAKFRIADGPILWFTPDYAEAVVDAAVLGDLKVVNATSLRVGERVEIGTLKQPGLGKLGAREFAEFLMRAGVIQTWIHIGSTMCLIAEDPGPPQRLEFIGEHEYYTNEENHDPLGFALEIAADGRITIIGIEPKPLPPAMPQQTR